MATQLTADPPDPVPPRPAVPPPPQPPPPHKQIPEGKQPYFLIPVFNYHAGYLSVNFSRNYFELSQRHPDVPRLGPEHIRALDLFEELAASPELAMHAVLEPGDIQLLNNHTTLHHRSAFTDHEVGAGAVRGWRLLDVGGGWAGGG